MRWLAFVLPVTVMAVPTLALADLVNIETSFYSFYSLGATQGGLELSFNDIGFLSLTSSNPLVGQTGAGGRLDGINLKTGPLVGNNANSWTFQGGTLSAPDSLMFTGIPPGYQTCEAAGLSTESASLCDAQIGIHGSLTGLATFRLGSQTGTADCYSGSGDLVKCIEQAFFFVAPLSFKISPDLALVLGVSAGAYAGTVDVTGVYAYPLSTGPNFLAGSHDNDYYPDSIQVEGLATPVPDLPTFTLLATVLGTIAIARRARTLKHP